MASRAAVSVYACPVRTAQPCPVDSHEAHQTNTNLLYAPCRDILLQYPITTAAFGAVYLIGRIAYFLGYKTGNPDNRLRVSCCCCCCC